MKLKIDRADNSFILKAGMDTYEFDCEINKKIGYENLINTILMCIQTKYDKEILFQAKIELIEDKEVIL